MLIFIAVLMATLFLKVSVQYGFKKTFRMFFYVTAFWSVLFSIIVLVTKI